MKKIIKNSFKIFAATLLVAVFFVMGQDCQAFNKSHYLAISGNQKKQTPATKSSDGKYCNNIECWGGNFFAGAYPAPGGRMVKGSGGYYSKSEAKNGVLCYFDGREDYGDGYFVTATAGSLFIKTFDRGSVDFKYN